MPVFLAWPPLVHENGYCVDQLNMWFTMNRMQHYSFSYGRHKGNFGSEGEYSPTHRFQVFC